MLFKDKRTGELVDVDESLLEQDVVIELLMRWFEPLELGRWVRYKQWYLYRMRLGSKRVRRGCPLHVWVLSRGE